MRTSKFPFYNVRPICFKVPVNTGPQKLDTLVTFYFLSNSQFEFLETKTVIVNHHKFFNELSAGIAICWWKVHSKAKIEKKRKYKNFFFPSSSMFLSLPIQGPRAPRLPTLIFQPPWRMMFKEVDQK